MPALFNPRDSQYKSKHHALKTGETVMLRLCLPREMHCTAAYFVVHVDHQENQRFSMSWDGMCGSDHEWWRISWEQRTPNLYWYHFEYDTAWGGGAVTKGYRSKGQMNWEGTDWQLTVYDSAFQVPDWFSGGILYQIFPDRFAKADAPENPFPDRVIRKDWGAEPYYKMNEHGKMPNNDFFGGTLQGIIEKLEYLKQMRVTCIYLNPVFEAHANHRYNTADYERIDPMLGAEADLTALCREAKKCGIRVILDGVFSHVGDDSKYFNTYGRYGDGGAYRSQESPYYPWFKFTDWPDRYQSWWGIDILPEIIEENEAFLNYITGENGIARKWIRAGISGWRLDVADELPDVFLDRLREAVKAEDPDAIILGEVWEDASNKFSYGARRRYLLGNQLDTVMNYPFADAIFNFIQHGASEQLVDTVLEIIENYPPQVLHALMNHIGTHDTMRAITRLAGEPADGRGRDWQSGRRLTKDQFEYGKQMLALATLLQYTLPGVPSIYYGDEAGMEGYGDPFNRACYPWGNEKPDLIEWYARVGRLREACPALKDGAFIPLCEAHGVIVFVRKRGEEQILIAINQRQEAFQFALPEEWKHAVVLQGAAVENGQIMIEGQHACVLGLGPWVEKGSELK